MSETTGPRGRPELVRARKRLGMSQAEAAEALLVTPTTLSRWERGAQEIRPVYRARMAEVFGVNGEQIERWLECADPVATELWPLPDFTDMSIASTVKSAEKLWRSELDLQRRHMLAALPFVPTAVDGWLSSWSYGAAATSVAGSESGRAVGLSDVRRIDEMRELFSRADHQYGGGLVRPAAVDYLNTTVAPLLRGSYDDRIGSALLTAAATMTAFVGWTAFDTGRQGLAQHYYGQALKLAKTADDQLTGALVLSRMTYQAIHLNQPAQASLVARAAVESARKAEASPRVMGMLLVRQAWADAIIRPGDRHKIRQIEALLGEAERVYGKGTSDRDPDWAARWDEPQFGGELGTVWELIGNNSRAADYAEQAIRAFETDRPRSAALNRVAAAHAQLGLGELDQAVDWARKAVADARSLNSLRLIERVKRFDKRLKPYEKSIHIREFRSYLDQAIAV
ncbi:helix-turn-helix transcriptional regulator [Thermopolyspora sp. NPDC052614]|uniref:helix-turn-helix domain-containing protein n=1 Tax=Thermopolyspora sp. NPDC052614 TaxID=3155682 RepID=UPI003449457E